MIYSSRRADVGSIIIARRAGTRTAIVALTSSTTIEVEIEKGSLEIPLR